MFAVNSINRSIQCLGVPATLRNYGPPWTDNILVPSPDWGTGGTATSSNQGSQPDETYGSVTAPSSVTVRTMLAYVHRRQDFQNHIDPLPRFIILNV